MNSTKLNGQSIRRILVLVFCIFIGACVSFVMFRVYNPNQNNLGALSSVSMDIICMLILIILIGSFTLENYGSNQTTKLFAILLIATIWAMFLDFLNWAFDGLLEFGQLTYWFTVGSLCMGSILAGIFSLYLNSYMEESHKLEKMRMRARACAILNLVSFFLAFILAVTGTAFRFVDGHYETGTLYDVVTVIPVLSLLYLVGYVIRSAKKVGLHDVFAVAGYVLFMIAGALIEAEYSIGTTYVSVAIADIFIFVMLQNAVIEQEKRNVQEWMKKSHTDELTGFYNRHAYENDIVALERSGLDDTFVYVSMDVNSLKMVNDTLGHTAGDELLVGAAQCIKKCFGTYGKLYRVGGDEFIALIFADDNQLNLIQKKMAEVTQKWSGELVSKLSISCGYVTQKENNKLTIRQIAVLADRRMYDAKSEYYRTSGIERRRR